MKENEPFEPYLRHYARDENVDVPDGELADEPVKTLCGRLIHGPFRSVRWPDEPGKSEDPSGECGMCARIWRNELEKGGANGVKTAIARRIRELDDDAPTLETLMNADKSKLQNDLQALRNHSEQEA